MGESRVVQRRELGLNVNGGALVLATGVVGLGFYLWHRAKQSVVDTANAVDPTNSENVFNTYAKKVAAAVTGQKPEDVSFAPEVKTPAVAPGAFSMTLGQKLDWLDKEISKTRTKLLASKTTAEKQAANKYLTELTKRRADVAAGKP